MALITLKDLAVNSTNKADSVSSSDSFIQDLSKDELALQDNLWGGCGKKFIIRLPNGRVVIGMDLCSPLPPNSSLGI